MIKPKSTRDKIFENFDRNLAIVGLVIGILMSFWLLFYVHKYIEVGVMCVLACGTYLLIRKSFSRGGISSLTEQFSRASIYLGLNMLFFVLFFLSIILIVWRPDLYSRPLSYFISITIMVAILAVEILFLPENKAHINFILFKIVIFCFGILCVPQFIFPGLFGVDTWFHQMIVTKIIETGTIPAGTSYSYFPIMHLLLSTTSLVTSLDYRSTVLCSMFVFISIALIFIFLISRSLFNPKVGLLAALLLGTGVEWMDNGLAPIPPTVGLIIIAILMYVILAKVNKQHKLLTFTILTVLFMCVLILTHTITATAMGIILFSFGIGLILYKIMSGQRAESTIGWYLFTLFLVCTLSWWTYSSGKISTLKEILLSGFHISGWAPSLAHTQYMLQVPYSEYLLGILGFLLFFALSIVGSFLMLSKKFGSKESFSMIIGGLGILLISFITLPLGLTGFLTERWWYYAYLIMAIPAAIGVFSIYRGFKSKLVGTSVMVVLILVLSFFSFTSPAVNFDNRIYNKDEGYRYAFTQSELTAFDTLASIWPGAVGVTTSPDSYFFSFNKGMPVVDISGNLLNKDFTNSTNVLVVINGEVTEGMPDVAGGSFRIDYDPGVLLEQEGFICMYSCADTNAYLKTPLSPATAAP
jgi:hypothetical protein